MTTRIDPALEVRQDRRLIRPNAHSKRFLLVTRRRPARHVREGPPAGQPRHRPRPLRVDVRRQARASPRRPSRRRSVASSRTTGSASSSTTTSSTSSAPPPGRRPRRDAAPSNACAPSRPAAARTWPKAGCAAASRSRAQLASEGVNRCLLLTDGLANVGITAPDELARHARELRARGVSTTTFGVGNDFDERLLQDLADAGGGHFYYIADAPQIRDAITSEVGETLETVARDVSLEITARDDIRIDAISPYRLTTSGNRTSVSLGDLVSEQVVEVVLRLSFPYGDLGRETGAIVALTDRDGAFDRGRDRGRTRSGSPGPTPTTARTTPSRAIATSTGPSPGCSPPAPGRRRSGATARATSTARAGSSMPPGRGSRATPGTTRRSGPSPARSPRNGSSTPPRWPRWPASRRTSRAPTCCAAGTCRVGRSSGPDEPGRLRTIEVRRRLAFRAGRGTLAALSSVTSVTGVCHTCVRLEPESSSPSPRS